MEDNKDYILNLRVSKETYDKIKNKAKKNGHTISALLRGVIDDSVEIISDISNDLAGKKHSQKFSDIISYHKAVLAQSKKCDNCDAGMVPGDLTTIGETASDKTYYFCSRCR